METNLNVQTPLDTGMVRSALIDPLYVSTHVVTLLTIIARHVT